MFKVTQKIEMPNTKVANNIELFEKELKEFFNKWEVPIAYDLDFRIGELVINGLIGKLIRYDEYPDGSIEIKECGVR